MNRHLLPIALHLLSGTLSVAADECAPWTWASKSAVNAASGRSIAAMDSYHSTPSIHKRGEDIQPGDINCRDFSQTPLTVNYYTCQDLADRNQVSVELIFQLNPDLDPDCGNIKPNTQYCVDGFIEPLRAFDGLCGPSHKNATCVGSGKGQCCNSETWTCGETDADCAPGVCWEGICFGDSIYSTDGTCGYEHGNRECAGKWGDCCNMKGQCGSGADFCGSDVCQSGNCTRNLAKSDTGLPWVWGTSPDGSCGGPQGYTCGVLVGSCCNKNGQCGDLPQDCGEGCQSEFGECKH